MKEQWHIDKFQEYGYDVELIKVCIFRLFQLYVDLYMCTVLSALI